MLELPVLHTLNAADVPHTLLDCRMGLTRSNSNYTFPCIDGCCCYCGDQPMRIYKFSHEVGVSAVVDFSHRCQTLPPLICLKRRRRDLQWPACFRSHETKDGTTFGPYQWTPRPFCSPATHTPPQH
ncbi:hypothetical protein TcWFU_008262 [Taenia crassiceps]|uniref:Uncharacterized protein n=1 Tax=Taenia crassiceps TaxID=6207 RepID=A0ABR4Q2W9_9CEST